MSEQTQDCRSEEGHITGLVDALLFIAREVATKDLTSNSVQEALADLFDDPSLEKLRAARVIY